MAISPQNNEETVFYTGKLYGLTGMSAHHSTETALLDVMSCLLGSVDESRVSILTLLQQQICQLHLIC